jgi:hypothetical protein
MSNSEISLSDLMNEQDVSSRRFVIEAVPDKGDSVRVMLVMPGGQVSCKAGIVMPSSAIRSIKKTGKTVSSCSKVLHEVEIEFSGEKLLSYDDVFDVIKDTHSSIRGAVESVIRASVPSVPLPPPFGRRPGSFDRRADYGTCMVDALFSGESGRRLQTMYDICEWIYG